MKTTITTYKLAIAFIVMLALLQVSFTRAANTITTGAISGSPFCPGAGSVISVTYSITGTFKSGNIFRAQLSNAAGSFASPTIIGSVTSVHEGTITANLGSNPPAGTGYRIRVVSTSPVADGSNNGADLIIFSAASCGTNWTTTGNGGVTAANAIGTINNANLNMQTNGVLRAVIDTLGNVGIGTATPGHLLDVYDQSETHNITANFINPGSAFGTAVYAYGGQIGVEGDSHGSSFGNPPASNYGLYGSAQYGISFGVYGVAYGGIYSTPSAYGIYGTAYGAVTNWAGYFVGNVYASGLYQSSDRKLKNDIKPLNGALSIINRLKPSVYSFKTDEYSQMHLPEGIHYGLIADEVQTVLPGAVKNAIQPAEYENHDMKNGKKISDEVQFQAVNYTEMIPVLIAAVKEQQAMIDKLSTNNDNLNEKNNNLEEEIHQLHAIISENNTMNTGVAAVSINATANTPLLGQNIPNPAANNTIIPFRIPKNCNSASIVISEVGSGKIITAIPVSCGETQLALEAGSLASGSYTYSLYVDGSVVDTKRMVLTK